MIKVSKGTPKNQTPDLGRTRRARMTVDIICKPNPGRTAKVSKTVDETCKLDPGRAAKARMTVDKACKLDPGRAAKVRMTVDIIHKYPTPESPKHETIRRYHSWGLFTL